MQKPIYTAEQEQELMAFLWNPAIADDPEAFVMAVYPWGQKGTPLEHFQGPRKWQRRILKQMATHIRNGQADKAMATLLRVARSSGRGIGKSALVAWLIDWFNTTRIGSTAIVSANTEAQLRTITWAELSKWTAMAIHSHWWEVSGLTRSPAKWLRELVETQLKKGTGYWGASGKLWSEENPDAYAGVHNHDGIMVIFDEASGIPDAIWAVANGYFTEPTPNRFWFAFSQGRRNNGYFFECFNKKQDLWDTDQIDARTVEGTDPQLYKEIIEEYGEDSDEARVEVYGQFPKSGDETFISRYVVDEAARRVNPEDKTAPVVIGVDPARGGDKFVILVRQGRRVVDIREFTIDTDDEEIGTMEGVGHVVDAINEFKPVLVVLDATGMGAVVYDRLKELRYKMVKGVNFAWKSKDPKRWGNKRAEMWGAMRKWLTTGSIPDNKRLKDDLSGPKKKPESSGSMLLEDKKSMRKRGLGSPDRADALAVTFAFPVANPVYNRASERPKSTPKGDFEDRYRDTGGSWMGC